MAFKIASRATAGVRVIALHGELGMTATARLSETMEIAVREENSGVVIDTWDLTFIDSMALSLLAASAERIRKSGRRFAVVADPAGHIAYIVELAGLATRLGLSPSLDAAVHSSGAD